MYTQLDLLLLMLRTAGYPLYLHNAIISWLDLHGKRSLAKLQRQSKKEDHGNLDLGHIFYHKNLLSRKSLLKRVAGKFGTTSREPVIKTIKLPSDHRLISITKFSFVCELMSTFHDKDLMRKEHFIDGYDIQTCKSTN